MEPVVEAGQNEPAQVTATSAAEPDNELEEIAESSVGEEAAELQSKVDELPASTREMLEDDYQATFLGVEKIDEDKLV